MSFWGKTLGLAFWIGVGAFDSWVWGGLFASNLESLGSVVGFMLLALFSIPITIFGGLIGLLLILADR